MLEETGGRGADVIYDSVGGDVFERSLKCIAWNGRLLVIGFAGGEIPSVKANRILLKNIAVVGLHWGAYAKFEPARIPETMRRCSRCTRRARSAPRSTAATPSPRRARRSSRSARGTPGARSVLEP